MDDLTFRIVTAILLISFIVHRGYYTRKVQHATTEVVEKLELGPLSQVANLLALPAFASTLLYIFVPDWLMWAALPFPTWLRWLGVGVALGGFALLQWAQMTLGKNWSDDPKLVKGQQVVANGPYRWIRHPIYAGFLLILGALLLITANAVVGGLWLAMTALDVTARMNAEEAMLLRQFGEPYRAYMQRTGRVLPRLGGGTKST